MAVTGPNRYCIVSFKLFLGNNFEITDLDKLKYMLEVFVIRDCSRCLIYLNQTVYIQCTITYFELEGLTLVSISFIIKHDITLFQLFITETEKCVYKDYSGNFYYFLLVNLFLFAT